MFSYRWLYQYFISAAHVSSLHTQEITEMKKPPFGGKRPYWCTLSFVLKLIHLRLPFFVTSAAAWAPPSHPLTFLEPTFSSTRRTKTTALLAVRQARRNLPKRRRKRRAANDDSEDATSKNNVDAIGSEEKYASLGNTFDSRSLVKETARERGEDYWIDPEALRRQKDLEAAIAARKASEGRIPDEKLWSEVLSPYKQNWIGIFSLVIMVLAAIITKFPELLNAPVIPIPDL